MQSRGREAVAGLDAQSHTSGILLFPPAHVGLRTCLLRTDVGEELFVGSLLTDSQRHAECAVAVVLHWSSAIKLAAVVAVRHVENHTEAEHIAYFCC